MKRCDICHKYQKIHYRVKSINFNNWVFSCKSCWEKISKQNNYCYGGTRKS